MWNSGQGSRRLTQRSGLVASVGVLSILGLFVGFIGAFGVAQSFAQESDRKVITRVEPDYPDALKKLYIGGVVRVEVEVAPNGAVRNVKLLGGNPILGQSTIKAVKMWKYAPAPVDELITVKLNFDPHK
jgi:TonB family protein